MQLKIENAGLGSVEAATLAISGTQTNLVHGSRGLNGARNNPEQFEYCSPLTIVSVPSTNSMSIYRRYFLSLMVTLVNKHFCVQEEGTGSSSALFRWQ
jgi:hypothetical protein